MKKLLVFVLPPLWLLAFAVMHLACFDLFGDDWWFHYVLAGLLLLAQLALVLLIRRRGAAAWASAVAFVLYAALGAAAIWFLAASAAARDPSPQGLTRWCLLLDLTGAAFCAGMWIRARKKAAGDGRGA